MAEMSRDAEIKGIWARYGWFYRLLRGAVLIGVGVLIGMIIYAEPQVRADYVMNLFVTVLSLGATALIFDELNRKRSEDDLKRQLVDDAASMSNEIAKNAVHQLRRKGWLEGADGLLKGADLQWANLNGANLEKANLEGANLEGAHLDGAIMNRANLKDANLNYASLRKTPLVHANLQTQKLMADLEGANLGGALLQGARLGSARLRGADMWLANLQGAYLADADFRGARNFKAARFDSKTVLPDRSLWNPKSVLWRFTDSKHPQFWKAPPSWMEDEQTNA